jgi:hypothetical protein
MSDDGTWLTAGPLSTFDVGVLREIFEKHGAEYKIYRLDEKIAEYHASIKQEDPLRAYRGFDQQDLLIIKFPLKHALLVRGELERMGHPIHSTPPEPLEAQPEFLCPKCGYMAHGEGFCPKHRVRLLEYSAWVAQRNKRISPVWIWLALAGIAAYVVYFNLIHSNQ